MKFWTTATKHQPLDVINPSWWRHVLYGIALHILHCCKHCLKQFKGTFGSIAESMFVKLPATLNIQPEYVLYTWGNIQSLWVPLFCHHFLFFSGDTQCCNKDWCECLSFAPEMGIWLKMETQGWGNWPLKTENVKFPVGCPPPFHPGANHW